jgi:hypothetical protein
VTDVERRGDVVLRPWRPWSATVLALLEHLRRNGFEGAPVPHGRAEDGREAVSWVPGDEAPDTWPDDGAYALGALLRDLHRAAATFVPDRPVWLPWWGRALGGGPVVIGHCDAAPWNVVARAGRPVALVDWDTAGPVGVRWELAQAMWLNARLFDDDVAARDGLPDVAARARTAALIAEGYGVARADRVPLLDAMVEYAIRGAAQEAVDAERDGASVNGGPPLRGDDLLRSMTWRARSAAFLLRERGGIERALRG